MTYFTAGSHRHCSCASSHHTPSKMSDVANEIMAMAARLPTSPNARPYVELRAEQEDFDTMTKFVFLFEEDGSAEVRKDALRRGSVGWREEDGSHTGNRLMPARELHDDISMMTSMGRFNEPALTGMIEGIICSAKPLIMVYVGVITAAATVPLMELTVELTPQGRDWMSKEHDLCSARTFFYNCAQVCQGWAGPSHPRV
jgi:hypothetical protein